MGAYMKGAYLLRAYLRAADLQGADLTDAFGLTWAQLHTAQRGRQTRFPDYLDARGPQE